MWGSLRGRALAAALFVCLTAAAVPIDCARSPAVPFISHQNGVWWRAPRPVSAELQQWGRAEAPRVEFRAPLSAAADGSPGPFLRIRALGEFRASLAGADGVVASSEARPDADWRNEQRVDLEPYLADSAAELIVVVRNRRGPALLWAEIDAAATPPAWRVKWQEGPFEAAVRADDTLRNPAAYAGVTPSEAFWRQSDTLLLLVVLGILGSGLWQSGWISGERIRQRLPLLALVAAGVAWSFFLARFAEIPRGVGFDAKHHLAYVDFLRQHHALPLATDGWSMFHPPLFYAAAAASLPPLPRGLSLHWLPFAAGLLCIPAVWRLARCTLPDQPVPQAVAVLSSALVPMHIYSSAYFSNESLHTLLASLALVETVCLLGGKPPSPWRIAGVGGLFGLAALSKFTVVAWVPVAAVCLAIRWGLARRRAAAVRLAIFGGGFAAVAGWWFVRNLLVFGDPFMANWGGMPGPGQAWWQWPGFRTASYYTGFGESLVHPYLAGFHSFADSLYSTFWGDGYLAGRVSPADRHGFWNYDFMSLAYWLGLPASLFLVLGYVLSAARALADPRPERRAVFGFLVSASYLVALGFFALSLRVPFYSQPKASYGLLLLGPLAIYFALAIERGDALLTTREGWGWRAARGLYHGWLCCLAGVLFLSFAG